MIIILLFFISNRKRVDFGKIREFINNERNKENNTVNLIDKINTNFNIYILHYPDYDEEELKIIGKGQLDDLFLLMRKIEDEINRLKKKIKKFDK